MDPSALNASMKKCDDAITKIIVDRGLAGKNPRLK
jgi:hypothetical protein